MSATIHLDTEGVFASMTTADMVKAAVNLLDAGDVILGDGDQDYAAAGLLNVLAVMHDDTGIDLELLPQARAFAYIVLNGRWTPPFVWEGAALESIGDLLSAASQAERDGKAARFLAAYQAVNEHADRNLGYVIGYMGDEDRARMYAAYRVAHPITGGAI